jgi:hypothetical protein
MLHPFMLEIYAQHHRETLLAEAAGERLARQANMCTSRRHLHGIVIGKYRLQRIKRRVAEVYASARSARSTRGPVGAPFPDRYARHRGRRTFRRPASLAEGIGNAARVAFSRHFQTNSQEHPDERHCDNRIEFHNPGHR